MISLGSLVVVRQGTILLVDPRSGECGIITLQVEVLLGPAVHIYVNNHPFDDSSVPINDQGHYPPLSAVVERRVLIDAGPTIFTGVSNGRYLLVAFGAIGTMDVAPFSVSAGNLGRAINTLSAAPADNRTVT